jgi:hypothetical protein
MKPPKIPKFHFRRETGNFGKILPLNNQSVGQTKQYKAECYQYISDKEYRD